MYSAKSELHVSGFAFLRFYFSLCNIITHSPVSLRELASRLCYTLEAISSFVTGMSFMCLLTSSTIKVHLHYAVEPC